MSTLNRALAKVYGQTAAQSQSCGEPTSAPPDCPTDDDPVGQAGDASAQSPELAESHSDDVLDAIVVHAADSRNQSKTMPPYDSQNIYGDRPAARNAQRPTYGRYDNPPTRGYRDTRERFNSPGSRIPSEQRGSRTDTRYAPQYNNSNPPNNAGIRGTIEPVPYRIR